MIYRENAVYLLPRERQQRRKGRQNIGTDKLISEKIHFFKRDVDQIWAYFLSILNFPH